MPQEEKLNNEISQLTDELNEQDAYIENRKAEIKRLESVLSQSREDFKHHRSERDRLQDERKYDFLFAFLVLLM